MWQEVPLTSQEMALTANSSDEHEGSSNESSVTASSSYSDKAMRNEITGVRHHGLAYRSIFSQRGFQLEPLGLVYEHGTSLFFTLHIEYD